MASGWGTRCISRATGSVVRMRTRIDADRLIIGDGELLENGSVVIEGSEITFVGAATEAPPTPETLTTETVMPGMWDAHTHFFGLERADIESIVTVAPQIAVLRSIRDLSALVDAGFTSVREVGGHGTYLARAVEAGLIDGPTIYASGSPLSQTGGHGDLHGLPVDVVDDTFERHFGAPSIADGADDCRRLVRRQLRLGAKVIKVCATGGVMSQVDRPDHQQFTDEELAAIVDEASRADRVVAAHCHGKSGIMAALRAGVRTIEHGSHLDAEAAAAMVDSGTILVPTRFVIEHLVQRGRELSMPDYALAKIEEIADRHLEALRTAIAAGVTIALGTDIFYPATYGRNGEELTHLVAAGMSPLDAITSATSIGPLTVGAQAPRTGRLAVGSVADVICVAGDPTTDISLLGDPSNVTTVFARGERVKG